MYAPRVVAMCRYTWLLVLLYPLFRMSEQAARAAGPPGSAALPQSLRSSSLGQSPQPKPRTASFSDDGCVSPISISNSVAASMSETSPAGRHPISDGGALNRHSATRADKGRMVLGGSGKVSFGRRIREVPCLRFQGELRTHSEVVSSPK